MYHHTIEHRLYVMFNKYHDCLSSIKEGNICLIFTSQLDQLFHLIMRPFRINRIISVKSVISVTSYICSFNSSSNKRQIHTDQRTSINYQVWTRKKKKTDHRGKIDSRAKITNTLVIVVRRWDCEQFVQWSGYDGDLWMNQI